MLCISCTASHRTYILCISYTLYVTAGIHHCIVDTMWHTGNVNINCKADAKLANIHKN